MIENNQKVFIFYGISGSGKGTQAKLLIEHLKKIDPSHESIYIETGARIREFINDRSGYTRDMVKDVIENGGLLPEFVPINLWSDLLINRFTGKEHLVLDGVARRLHETSVVESAARFYGFKEINVVLINVSKNWAKEKLKGRGRSDDDEAEIDHRFSWYEKNTMPAINYFRDKPDFNFFEIDGEQSIDKVQQDILEKLNI